MCSCPASRAGCSSVVELPLLAKRTHLAVQCGDELGSAVRMILKPADAGSGLIDLVVAGAFDQQLSGIALNGLESKLVAPVVFDAAGDGHFTLFASIDDGQGDIRPAA